MGSAGGMFRAPSWAQPRTAAQHNRERGVTAYDFTFDPSRGVVRGKEPKVRSIVFDQRRRGR